MTENVSPNGQSHITYTHDKKEQLQCSDNRVKPVSLQTTVTSVNSVQYATVP